MQLLVNSLIAGSLAALLAGGLAFVYGVLGVFNLALGQLALVGGYSTWWFHQQMHWPLLPSIFCGLVIASVVTWISFEIFVAPFYKRHPFLPLVTTIALSMILDGLILMLFQERSRSIFPNQQFLTILDARISVQQLSLVVGTFLFICLIAFVLHSTAFGRRLRAVVQHDHAARSLGIPAAQLHRIIFIMSGLLAACGGIFIGIDQVLSPTLGFPLTIKAYAALIAGGKDNLWGTILCAYIIALLEQLAVGLPWFFGGYINASFQSVVALLFIIVVLLIKPSGLFSRHARLA